MRAFSNLCATLECSSPVHQQAALADYLSRAAPKDAAWALYFLSGRRLKRVIRNTELAAWAAEAAGLPPWLFDEAHTAVGDLAEAVALLLPDGPGSDRPLHEWVERRLRPAEYLSAEARKQAIVEAWMELDHSGRHVWNRWITGSYRSDVEQRTLLAALSDVTGLDPFVLAYRFSRAWEPTEQFFADLTRPDGTDDRRCRPYPFHRPAPFNPGFGRQPAERPFADWHIEWKWSGIRVQVVRRGGRSFIWSEASDLLTDAFPEVRNSALVLRDGVVLDGEIVAWCDGAPGPFKSLRPRLHRSSASRSLLSAAPICFLASDILEAGGRDIRHLPLRDRRRMLDETLRPCTDALRIHGAPVVEAASWSEVIELYTSCRDHDAAGLVLKRLDGEYDDPYASWIWKAEPFTIDAVLIYVESGRTRATSEYTFGVWDGDDLVPIARADVEPAAPFLDVIDEFIRNHTVDRFGPVRAIEPVLVFRLGFDDIRPSPRRRSGYMLRNPRVLQLLEKDASDAHSLDSLRKFADTVEPRTELQLVHEEEELAYEKSSELRR